MNNEYVGLATLECMILLSLDDIDRKIPEVILQILENKIFPFKEIIQKEDVYHGASGYLYSLLVIEKALK